MKRRGVSYATDWPMHSQGMQCTACGRPHMFPMLVSHAYPSSPLIAVLLPGLHGHADCRLCEHISAPKSYTS